MSVATHTIELARPLHTPTPSRADAPSIAYLVIFIVNSLAIILSPYAWLNPLLMIVQGFFFVGLLEMTHQSVHHAFIVSSRKWNEAAGLCAAALIGINMITYRYFHLEHHRHTCDAVDPEGFLYADSPRTRWFILGAPIAHLYVALGINRLAGRYVPQSKRAQWWRAQAVLITVMIGLLCWCLLSPISFLQAYLIPLCLFAWFDFLFSQAEHYGAPIRKEEERCNVASVSYDIKMPLWLSHLMLNRNLHRVHHVWPRTRWFEAPERMTELNVIQPSRVLSLRTFGKRWWADGPRLWH